MCELYTMIDKRCKERGTNVTQMCNSLNLTRSMLSELKAERTKSLTSDVLAKIADHLECSVDYLLGRTDNPTSHIAQAGSTVNNAPISGNFNSIGNSGSITVSQTDTVSKEESEILRIYSKLDVRGRTNLLNAAFALEDETNKQQTTKN